MNITEKTMVGELVAQDYRAASIFKSHGIDFCCNGGRSIADACAKKSENTEALIRELELALQKPSEDNPDFRTWDADLLVDYIEKKHHRYVRQRSAEIVPFLEKVRRVHGQNHPELIELEQEFLLAIAALESHMKKEEMVLFPYIRQMSQALSHKEILTPPYFGSVEGPIEIMHEEHDTEGVRFRKISDLTNQYSAPKDACNTYQVAYALLKEFEEDLHRHIHLENNILFPKAVHMEEQLADSIA